MSQKEDQNLDQNNDTQIDEAGRFESDYEDSSVFEPVEKSVKARRGDKTTKGEKQDPVPTKNHVEGQGPNKMVRPADNDSQRDQMQSVKVKEGIESLFSDDENLTEDFKEKASVIFESIVQQRINEEIEVLEKQYEDSLAEEVQKIEEDYVEKLDKYLDYVAENWLTENELEVEKGIRLEVAESFMNGIKGLFVEHNIDVPEEQFSVVEELSNRVEELENRLNESLNENIELEEQLEQIKLKEAFDDVSEDLSYDNASQLESLVEGISYNNIDDFKRKVEIIKEKYFSNETDNSNVNSYEDNFDSEPLVEEYEDESPQNNSYDPIVNQLFNSVIR